MKVSRKTIDKLVRDGNGIDVGKYRYIFGQFGTIIRCPIKLLDRLLPLGEKWEIVARWNNDRQDWDILDHKEYGY